MITCNCKRDVIEIVIDLVVVEHHFQTEPKDLHRYEINLKKQVEVDTQEVDMVVLT